MVRMEKITFAANRNASLSPPSGRGLEADQRTSPSAAHHHALDQLTLVWGRSFDAPIPLPGGGELSSVRDAGQFIASLPKREHDAPQWRAAVQALLLVVERAGRPVSCIP